MDWLIDLMNWFAGKPAGGGMGYHRLVSCMRGDTLWIVITVGLDLAVAAGYVVIARHWSKNQKALRNPRAAKSMGRIKNIFIFCGICGYAFIPVKMFWPAWRLYDIVMAVLVYYTWRYALDSRNLSVVYGELNRSDELAADLEKSREESRRKTYFLNAVSHDLRTPLNGLSLQVDLAALTLDAGDTGGARKALVEARQSLEATARLVGHFLELAHLDWDQPEHSPTTFGLTDAVRRSAERSAADAQAKGLALAVTGDDGLRVHTDQAKLERIIAQLVSNGVKFTVRGGVHVDVRATGGGATVDVTDTGVGICQADQARMFEEFFQGHNAARDHSRGVGLGLAVAKRLADQLGMELRVTSEPGKGSRFTLVIGRGRIVDSGNGNGIDGSAGGDVAVAARPAAGGAGNHGASYEPQGESAPSIAGRG
ncbi:MAG TPA: HAMP domain-containing sensor histidine kinase [Tepidisphaeraceae bacterium]|nr:HAMP domain-containing sensor histidine kinase [Tepidisphaeraceae bacterium]